MTTKKLKPQRREMTLKYEKGSQRTADDGNPIIRVSVSSEYPVERYDGIEILDHSPSSVDLSRLNDGAPFLVNHNQDDQAGKVLENSVTLDPDRVLRADIKFSRGPRGQEIMQDMLDGIRSKISVMYRIRRMELSVDDNGADTYRVTDWLPLEVSTVAIPADPTVGVGRNAEEAYDCEVVGKDEPVTTQEEAKPTEVESAQVEAPKLVAATEGERSTAISATNLDENMKDNNETETKPNATVGEDHTAKARKEMQEIAQLAFEHGMSDKTAEWLAAGRSLASVQSEILKVKSNKTNISTSVATDVANSMSEAERKEYSVANAILSMASGKRDGIMFDISDEIAKKTGRSAQGFFMPTYLRTALDSKTANAAKEMVFNTNAGFIDLLRPYNVALNLGAQYWGGVSGKPVLVRQSGSAGATWIAENGSGVTQTNPTFDTVTLAGKTVMTTVGFSRQLQQLGSFNMEDKVRLDIAKAFATALDKAALAGSGSADEPVGILYTTGVNVARSITSGSAITYAACVAMETKVAEANALAGKLAYVFSPGVNGNLKTTLQAPASASAFILGNDGKVNGYQSAVTNNVPQNLTKDSIAVHAGIFGDFSQLVIADWGAIDLMVDPYSSKNKALIEVTGYYLCDIGIEQPSAFSILKDIIKV